MTAVLCRQFLISIEDQEFSELGRVKRRPAAEVINQDLVAMDQFCAIVITREFIVTGENRW